MSCSSRERDSAHMAPAHESTRSALARVDKHQERASKKNSAAKVTLTGESAAVRTNRLANAAPESKMVHRALETLRDDTPMHIRRYFRGPAQQLLRDECDALLRPLTEGGHESLLLECLADPAMRLSMKSFEYAVTRTGSAFDALFRRGAGARFADREETLKLVYTDTTRRRPGEDADMLAVELATRLWERARSAHRPDWQ